MTFSPHHTFNKYLCTYHMRSQKADMLQLLMVYQSPSLLPNHVISMSYLCTFLLKVLIMFASTVYLLSLFHSLITLFVIQFLPSIYPIYIYFCLFYKLYPEQVHNISDYIHLVFSFNLWFLKVHDCMSKPLTQLTFTLTRDSWISSSGWVVEKGW